jgi:N-acetylglucosaminyl-diphospho-decaprenol L-rhamnosyltransferase
VAAIHFGPVHDHTMDAVGIDVVIVVVAYNSAHVIGDLLDSLPGALDGVAAKVVVVDNASTDATLEVLRARSDCTVVRSTNVGYAGGINRGVAAASSKAPILILNPDTRLLPGSVTALLGGLDDSAVGIVAPKILSSEGKLHYSLRREPSLARAAGLTFTRLPVFSEYVQTPVAYETAHVVDWALGAALLVSRQCWDAVGGWDESYFLYSEETDFCLTARDLGYRTWYEPGAVLVHIGAQSGQSAQIHAMQIINRVRLFRRRNSLLLAWAYFALTVVSECSWGLRGHGQSWFAIRALLRPALRPAALGCSDRVMPD